MKVVIAASLLLALAACVQPESGLPFRADGRVFVVTGTAQHTAIAVTGPAGAALSQGDGPAADRVFAQYCATQGRRGVSGSFVTDANGVGFWRYPGCRL